MRITDPKIIAALAELDVQHLPGASLAERTSLGIGGTTDVLLVRRHASLPDLVALLDAAGIPHRFLGGGSNVLIDDGELPWVILQLAHQDPAWRFEGTTVWVDAAPGSIGGALRMNAGAYGTQIGSYVREVEVFESARRAIRTQRGSEISFEYRHTSFAPDDIMLSVKLELPAKPYSEILEGIRICNQKRRASQPLNQKSAGCIFKNPPGFSAGRMIDELGLKGFAVGGARVSDRHANFFVNADHATAADMLGLISEVRERVRRASGVSLEEEVIVWKA